MNKSLRIGIVAGEASGDILGAGLIKALKEKYPNARFEGIGGANMMAEGFHSFFPMEKLSVFGLFEVLKHLPELLKIRRYVVRHFLDNPPDVFIGIDAPDFCIPVEAKFKAAGIKTVHYVGPSIWAWRQKRVFKVKAAADMVLCLLPFEVDFYKKYDVPAVFVGHTLADQLPLEPDTAQAKQSLGLRDQGLYLTIMPGSRKAEVERLGPSFLEAAARCHQVHPELEFLIPAANPQRLQQIRQLIAKYPQLKCHVALEASHTMLAAGDAVLLASGTAALEALLLKKPMVVSYRLSRLTWEIGKRVVKTPWVSLPNLLANREIVPELLQDEGNPENLAEHLLDLLQDGEAANHLQETYRFIHKQLKRNADERAAEAVAQVLGHPTTQPENPTQMSQP